MRKIETLFISIGLFAALAGAGAALWNVDKKDNTAIYEFPDTNFGLFLAAQHAVYINDFDTAATMGTKINDVEYTIIQNTRYLSQFLSGQMPDAAKLLKEEKNAAARLIYDAYLVQNVKWDELYKRHKNDESALSAPLRIWSSVATKRVDDALKFIKALPTNDAWKSFVRGQIYAETGKKDDAAREFAKVRTDFMNINDYQYLMSFYRHNEMTDAAEKLRAEFTSKPGGMFMAQYDTVPEWSTYSGYQNALAFSLVQNVSHTQIMMYSDLSILMLRFAQIVGTDFSTGSADAINYYLGQFFFNNSGDYSTQFAKISKKSPFFLFTVLRRAETSKNMEELADAMSENPLFVPGSNKLIAHYIQHGNRRAALRTVNRALDNKNLDDAGHAFFLKSRAHIYYMFGDFDAAQSDLHNASDILSPDGEILALQAKIWAAQNREIQNAYDYAMQLVRLNPTDIIAWDTLGYVVYVREGVDAALEVLERVGEISVSCSSLFGHLGDLYAEQGDTENARAAYMRAIDLSDDGLTVIPEIEKKIRKLK